MSNEKTAKLYQLAQKSAYTFFPLKKFGKKDRLHSGSKKSTESALHFN